MKVVNLAVDDWSNFSHDNCQSMRSVGIDAYSYKLNSCDTYPNQSVVCDRLEMAKHCKDADFIQIVHNNAALFRQLLPHIQGKKINVIYTGTDYRVNHENLQAQFNPYVNKSVIALGEFSGLGAKNEVYMVGAVNTDYERKQIKKPYLIAHYPSNPDIKGTKEICASLVGFKNFICSTDRVNFNEQFKRLSECDIYIELLAPFNNGFKYGSFGISALEAAALGKIVVTQNLSQEVYEDNYGHCPFILIQNSQDLVSNLIDLTIMSEKSVNELSQETQEWVKEKHSYKATGEYMLKHILV